MKQKRVLAIVMALSLMLAGCSGITQGQTADTKAEEPIQEKITVEISNETSDTAPAEAAPSEKPKSKVELDPEWKESVQKMSERKVIAVTHAYMNYLWCDESGIEIKGEPVEVFQELQARWNSFAFDQSKNIENSERKLEEVVNQSFDLAKIDLNKENNKDAHRIMHHLDYFVLEITSPEKYVYPYPYSTPFWNGQLKDWRK